MRRQFFEFKTYFKMNLRFRAMVNTVALMLVSTPLGAEESGEIQPEVLVLSSVLEHEPGSVEESLEKLETIPGGASVNNPEFWTGRTAAPEEIFQFSPGVYARSRGVGNDTRISIRGSGSQRQFGDRGLNLLIDGIPANDSDGSFYFRVIDPFGINHIEVFRGANGLSYGGSQLGGAINIVSKNGSDIEGGRLQVEVGSHDSYRSHFSYGGVEEAWDWYYGYSYVESGGYRDRQDFRTHQFNANVGYQWSDQAETRFYFLYSDSDAELTGSLTPDEFRSNPRQAQPGRASGVDRDLSTIRLGQRTKWDTKKGRWSFYTGYQYLDFDHLINQGDFRFNRLIDYDSDEFQTGLHGEEDWSLFGLDHKTIFDLRYHRGRQKEDGFGGFVRRGEAPVIDRENIASQLQLYLENDFMFLDRHHVILGLGYIASHRDVSLNRNDETGDESGSLTDEGVVYRVGYLYELNEQTQVFSNYSQSLEASPFSEVGTSLDPRFEALVPQIAQTFELGVRFEEEWAKGELLFYHASVNDEFVEEETSPGVSGTTNLDTKHQGIEAALTIDINKALGGTQAGVNVFLDQSYQWNDFTIEEGSNKGRQLPGISRHVYTGRLRVEDFQKRWKVNLSAEWAPDGLVVDNANTIETAGFINWRLSGEVDLNETVSLYGGVDNLFDKNYVNSVTVNPSSDSFINPSNGRSFYAGVKIKW